MTLKEIAEILLTNTNTLALDYRGEFGTYNPIELLQEVINGEVPPEHEFFQVAVKAVEDLPDFPFYGIKRIRDNRYNEILHGETPSNKVRRMMVYLRNTSLGTDAIGSPFIMVERSSAGYHITVLPPPPTVEDIASELAQHSLSRREYKDFFTLYPNEQLLWEVAQDQVPEEHQFFKEALHFFIKTTNTFLYPNLYYVSRMSGEDSSLAKPKLWVVVFLSHDMLTKLTIEVQKTPEGYSARSEEEPSSCQTYLEYLISSAEEDHG